MGIRSRKKMLLQTAEGVIVNRWRSDKRELGFLSVVDIKAPRLTSERRREPETTSDDHCCSPSSQETPVWTCINIGVDPLLCSTWAHSRWVFTEKYHGRQYGNRGFR